MKFTYRAYRYRNYYLPINEYIAVLGVSTVVTICSKPIPQPTRLEKIIRWFREKLGFSGAF